MADFPIIDIADIEHSDSQAAIANKITEASQTWGFLLLKNHQIPLEDINEMFELTRDFLVNTPEEQKAPWPINDKYVGYTAPLSDVKKDDSSSVWFPGHPGLLYENIDALPPYWRSRIDKVEAFERHCNSLMIKLLVCFALALDLPDRDHFAKAHAFDDATTSQFRVICYPARGNRPPSVTRLSPHSDSGSVTLLFQTCAGLEIESPDGAWVAAPHLPGHILVNLGDALAFWSGGKLKATKHRVTYESMPHDAERFTMAYFGKAAPDTVLQPIKTHDDDGQSMKDYRANGLVLQPGITVRELTKIIMEGIYGADVAPKPSSDGMQQPQIAT